MSTKETNPKDALGIAKQPFSVIPANVLAEVGVGMYEGAAKYGRHNYRAVGVRASVYYDATQRHLTRWWEGEDVDADSGLSHVTKAICSLVVLRDAMIRRACADDRPPATPEGFFTDLDGKAAALVAKYPNPIAPVTGENVERWAGRHDRARINSLTTTFVDGPSEGFTPAGSCTLTGIPYADVDRLLNGWSEGVTATEAAQNG